ncbi:MAG TPA: proton-conducting transporter membrane subunit [Aeromicrobium sp.]|nr:proton-conducting transporter membrane subunit [Aeromicrobium sp.]HKY56881.1 proton-conducting transporter membrane subunit [Aeromicrobium sp.]
MRGPGSLLRGRRWPYVALTGLVSGAVAWWAIPHLGTRTRLTVTYQGNDIGPVLPTLSLDTLVSSASAQVMLLAAAVAFLVQLYSTKYMGADPRYRSYALLIVLFLVAMVAVVGTDNLFVLLIGWEVMGVCSYLLIGHHWERDDAQSGAAKALLVTRAADIGLLLAILVLGQTYGTYSISQILVASGLEQPRNATLIGLLLIVAVVGKSAQVPLQTWLPDAMPGPTPITALIHAATMVAAGVFLLARLLPVYATSEVAMTTLAVVAAVTMLSAALFALVQSDLKRALAWSTVSQLAIMFAAVAVADGTAAIDHLVSHGVFKALLFLGCGVVMHTVGSSALADMGGLRKAIPVTFWTMTIGFLALAGIAPTVGFFSKDGVLEAVHHDGGARGDLLLAVVTLTSVLTAAYATRLWALTFLGTPKERHRTAKALAWPLLVLALAVFALSIGKPLHLGIAALSTGASVVGILFGWLLRKRTFESRVSRILTHELGFDRIFSGLIPALARLKARTVVWVDDTLVDSYPRGSAHSALGAGWLMDRFQSAKAQLYATAIAVGSIALVAYALWVGR